MPLPGSTHDTIPSAYGSNRVRPCAFGDKPESKGWASQMLGQRPPAGAGWEGVLTRKGFQVLTMLCLGQIGMCFVMTFLHLHLFLIRINLLLFYKSTVRSL